MCYKPLSELFFQKEACGKVTLVFWICADPIPKARSILVLLSLNDLAVQNHIP